MKRGGFGPRATPLSHGNAPLKRTTSLPRGKLTRNPPSLPRAPFRAGRGGGETPQRSSTGLSQSVREKVYARDDNRCVRCGRAVAKGSRQVHHRVPRGRGGREGHDRLSALITLCGTFSTDPDSCHERIESHRLEAQAGGWLVPWGSTSLTMPCLYSDGVRYLLDDDGDRAAYEGAT